MGELIRCPYCLTHWLCFATIAVFGPQYRLTNNWLDYIVFAFVLVFIASVVSGIVIRSFSGLHPVDSEEINAILNPEQEQLDEKV